MTGRFFTDAGKPIPYPSGAVHPARTSVADMRTARVSIDARTAAELDRIEQLMSDLGARQWSVRVSLPSRTRRLLGRVSRACDRALRQVLS